MKKQIIYTILAVIITEIAIVVTIILASSNFEVKIDPFVNISIK